MAYSTLFEVRHGYKDDAGWHQETASFLGEPPDFVSLALDSAGRPHISYKRAYGGDLRHSYKDESGWQTEIVCASCGDYASLALDSLNRPHISYETGGLKYAYKAGGAWNFETVITGVGSHLFTSIAVDSQGYPHISFQGNMRLGYASRDSEGWDTSTIDSVYNSGRYSSLILDGADHPHISYRGNGPTLKYVRGGPEGWATETIGAINAGYTSIGLCPRNYPVIGYLDLADNWLKVAWGGPTGWTIETIDEMHH